MNKKLTGLVGVVLSVILLVYFECFMYKVIGLGIDVNSLNNTLQILISLGIKLIMCSIIYLLYKRDFKRKKDKVLGFKDIIVYLITFIVLIVSMYLFEYIIKFIGEIFNINVIEKSFYNIFAKKLDFNLVIKIISDYLIIPFLYCSIIILSIDKLVRSDTKCIMCSGLLVSIIHALSLSGTLGFVIINSLSIFVLFGFLAYLYRKKYNIWYIILLYSFYLIGYDFIINYIRW